MTMNFDQRFVHLALLIAGALGIINYPRPENQAVQSGTSVIFNCSSDQGIDFISWSLVKVNSFTRDGVSTGQAVRPSYKSLVTVEVVPDKNQCNLIINSASSQLAGCYLCSDDGGGGAGSSAQLIVLGSNPVSSSNISTVTELYHLQIVMMSCSVSYVANSSYVNAIFMWSSGSTPVNSSRLQYTTSRNLTTANSTIYVDVGYISPFPVYKCLVSFTINARAPNEATNLPNYNYAVTPPYSPNISVFYIKPVCSITGADELGKVYAGSVLTCGAEANPPVDRANYQWTDRNYGSSINDSSIQVWHSGEYMCTGQNVAGECTAVIYVTTFLTSSAITIGVTDSHQHPSVVDLNSNQTNDISAGAKIGIGVGVGLGFLAVFVTTLAIFCVRYRLQLVGRSNTGVKKAEAETDQGRERSQDDAIVLGRSTEVGSQQPYEPLSIIQRQEPSYEPLNTVNRSNVQPVVNENRTNSIPTDYQSLEHIRGQAHEYETLNRSHV